MGREAVLEAGRGDGVNGAGAGAVAAVRPRLPWPVLPVDEHLVGVPLEEAGEEGLEARLVDEAGGPLDEDDAGAVVVAAGRGRLRRRPVPVGLDDGAVVAHDEAAGVAPGRQAVDAAAVPVDELGAARRDARRRRPDRQRVHLAGAAQVQQQLPRRAVGRQVLDEQRRVLLLRHVGALVVRVLRVPPVVGREVSGGGGGGAAAVEGEGEGRTRGRGGQRQKR